ncbi:MAG: DUF4342 domain-containing protein [Candidatus Promineofilum sp.]|nr:DUF4342 domain-containing protein [Promineifilum sp.]
MTDETNFDTDELKDEAKRATERISVAGSDLIKTVQGLLREAAVRRITVQDKNGRTLIEIPLYAGVIGALLIGSWTVLALVAAWFAEVSILIERDVDADGESSVAAEALDRAAAGASEAARSAAGAAKSGLGAAIGGAAHAAGDLARRAADSLEGRLGQSDDYMAQGEKAAEAIIRAAESAADATTEPRQCAAITKSGTRCKRTAAAGSEYCSMHQPA